MAIAGPSRSASSEGETSSNAAINDHSVRPPSTAAATSASRQRDGTSLETSAHRGQHSVWHDVDGPEPGRGQNTGHLVDEQRVPRSAVEHRINDRRGNHLSDKSLEQLADLGAVELLGGEPAAESGHVAENRIALSIRPQFVVPVRADDQDGYVGDRPHEEPQQFERVDVGDMEIVEDEDDRSDGEIAQQSWQCRRTRRSDLPRWAP